MGLGKGRESSLVLLQRGIILVRDGLGGSLGVPPSPNQIFGYFGKQELQIPHKYPAKNHNMF